MRFVTIFLCLLWALPIHSLLSPTVNATTTIAAPRSSVWPKVRAVDEWSSFTNAFNIALKGGNGVVEVGQDLLITTDLVLFTQQTINRIYDITEQERLCWRLESLVFLGLEIPVPSFLLRTERRCIELFDTSDGGTVVNNWEVFGGLFWPAAILLTGPRVGQLFGQFVTDLAALDFNSFRR